MRVVKIADLYYPGDRARGGRDNLTRRRRCRSIEHESQTPRRRTHRSICGGVIGLLWLLQGTGLLRIRPILCIANCEEIVGPSPVWAVSGLIALVIGAIVVFVSVRGIRRP
ncbi:hypothetical protein [Methanoculleus chikugoensis]|uniref:hypothetical protein n=1 Tax=Methanoculleus chikugoensis TaxID=118126 RepID=UPI000AA93946|nr:hypothetical protein [Methanoculleus chikugoensis]